MLKYLPIVFGLFLGWLMTHPPDFLDALGHWRYVGAFGIASALFVAFIAAQISASLPEALQVTANDSPLPDDLKELLREFRQMGFEPGSAINVHITPPALAIPAFHPDSETWALIFRTGTVPARASFDFLSKLNDDQYSLTTGRDAGGGSLPCDETCFKQLFPNLSPGEIRRKHEEALAFLAERGLRASPARAGEFPTNLVDGMRRQRRYFRKSPLRTTLVTLWRAITNRNPHLVPVAEQALVHRVLRQAGLSPSPTGG